MKRLIFVSLFVLLLQLGMFAQNKEFDLGMKAAKTKDFQTALEHFQNSKDQNPSEKKLAQIHYNIGVCYYQLQYFANAIGELKEAVKLKPNYEKAFYALGMAEADLQNWKLAETAFLQSLKLSKGRNGETWFDLAFVYIRQKKYDEAFISFQKSIEFETKSVAASHNNLGVIYALLGNLQMANKEIETAKKLGYSGAETNLAVLQNYLKTYDRTIFAKLNFEGEN